MALPLGAAAHNWTRVCIESLGGMIPPMCDPQTVQLIYVLRFQFQNVIYISYFCYFITNDHSEKERKEHVSLTLNSKTG